MPDITQTCRISGKLFVVTEEDQAFYAKMEVPMPTLCPEERLRRRLAFRNERNLHKRQCSLCNKAMISMFDANVPFPVYCKDCWWSDRWDPADYGQDFDFSRPFFEQFAELLQKVPKINLLVMSNENSEYSNFTGFSRNTYMSPGCFSLDECYYARKSQHCKDCVNCNAVDRCELVAFSTNCNNCYNSKYLFNCRNCSDSSYLDDCLKCTNCFMCSGLRDKKFHYKNQAYSQEDYGRILQEYAQKSPEEIQVEFDEFSKNIPKRAHKFLNCENCSGDYLCNSKNAQSCFDCFDIQDSKYLVEAVDVKDSMDLCMHDKEIELCYELSAGAEKNYMTKFSFCCCAAPNTEYSYSCLYLADGFGCDGFHSRNKNFIFNKQYSPEEYAALRSRIIEHMRQTGEYGEFFPIWLSRFAYNETVAHDYFPLSKEHALQLGYRWRDEDQKQYQAANQEILACERCHKNYRIIAQEAMLYQKLGCGTPKTCPDCRWADLFAKKNGFQLWDRACGKCGVGIQTTYSPERPEMVYCEECYLAEVY